MQASPENITQWSQLYERGDNNLLAKILGIAPQNVSVIRTTGKGSLTQIASIQKFYKNRKKELEKVTSELNDQN